MRRRVFVRRDKTGPRSQGVKSTAPPRSRTNWVSAHLHECPASGADSPSTLYSTVALHRLMRLAVSARHICRSRLSSPKTVDNAPLSLSITGLPRGSPTKGHPTCSAENSSYSMLQQEHRRAGIYSSTLASCTSPAVQSRPSLSPCPIGCRAGHWRGVALCRVSHACNPP